MNRDEQEMALWRRVFERWYSREEVEQFRKRYPAEPTAPAPAWYDEPPFEKDGPTRPCWVAGQPFPCAVYWSGHEWLAYVAGDSHVQRLNGRRVSPIAKPPEPTK